MKRNSQSGVALVITLILLSVITFMAVTFLVVSRHEGAQVDTITQQVNAKFAADSGLQQAMAQASAQMLASGNGLNFGLMVSANLTTNFFNNSTNLTDVSYYEATTGKLLTGVPLEKMLNNLLILPRPPVFVVSNRNQTTPAEFRFYLDLNRNGVYDTNGLVNEVDGSGKSVQNIYVGDPEWIGVLNHPEARHSASNFFVARYCFIALPIGNSLDINYIHNQSKLMSPWDNGFLRNQGVGSWEINLAAFLHEINPNWDNPAPPYSRISYNYSTINGAFAQSSIGSSFDDATAIVQYRYANDYHNLRSFRTLYASINNLNALPAFTSDYIDGYSHGPLMTGLTYPFTPDPDASLTKSPWSGDFSTNQYFTTQDLFNSAPYFQNLLANAPTSFSNHLYSIGRSYSLPFVGSITNSYNRYTFYKMLSQMSFGSAPESAYPYSTVVNPNYSAAYPNTSKLNLNYNNIGTNSFFGFVPLSATNFVPWTAAQFFTNAADRMLRAYFPNPILVTNFFGNQRIVTTNYITITNIPIYPANLYTPAVHRIIQLAANIYDASTYKVPAGSVNPKDFDYPSVFRPIYYKTVNATGTNIYITGYQEVTNNVDYTAPKDLRRPFDMAKFPVGINVFANVYGVPYVIGAKSGFPNFNQFSTAPITQISRKMQLVRQVAGGPIIQTNVQYIIGISNVMAVECWNSYISNYSRALTVYVTNEITMVLTNEFRIGFTNTITNGNAAFIPANQWSGYPLTSDARKITPSFILPLSITNVFLYDSVMQPPILNPNASAPFITPSGYPAPQWVLSVTNRLRLMMVDQLTGRLIDYVELSGMDTTRNLTADTQPGLHGNLGLANIWDTNRFPSGFNTNQLTYGMISQIGIGSGSIPITRAAWTSAQLNPLSQQAAIQDFSTWLTGTNDPTLTKQVPFVPTAKYSEYMCWQANDPLVHYLTSDLTDLTQSTNLPQAIVPPSGNLTNVLTYLRVLNPRYQPWGVAGTGLLAPTANNLAYKDPLITRSDAWQFPTNKYPNIGWLGRVHRGTPWQTVYLKSTPVNAKTWDYWTGNSLVNYNGVNDPLISVPSSDWLLMDLFTSAPNDNASKGQLSINQSGLAAWASVLDGVFVVSNAPAGFVPICIDPANTCIAAGTTIRTNTVQYLVSSINAARANTTNYPGGVFTSLGQICSVPQLTVNSPYLDTVVNTNSLNDAAYERIPQQIMSLLRVGTPRYVVFAYGQSLKPADHSIVQSGPYFGMCTNYQITGEVATRSVVRFDQFPLPTQPAGTSKPRAVVESFNVLAPE